MNISEYFLILDDIRESALMPRYHNTGNYDDAYNSGYSDACDYALRAFDFINGRIHELESSLSLINGNIGSPPKRSVIYVDDVRSYFATPSKGAERFFGNGKSSCHLSTDGDLEELHKFAEGIGLKRSWFQNSASVPHYDLTPSKRALAVSRGAIEVSIMQFIKLCRPVKQENKP